MSALLVIVVGLAVLMQNTGVVEPKERQTIMAGCAQEEYASIAE